MILASSIRGITERRQEERNVVVLRRIRYFEYNLYRRMETAAPQSAKILACLKMQPILAPG
jgi:hypothetical protein